MESGQDLDPAAALRTVGAARSDLADRLVTPRWYHPALGLSLGLLVASFALRNGWIVLAASALCVFALWALPRAYRRLTGVWVDGVTPPRARRWSIALGATAATCLLLSLLLSGDGPQRWGCVVAGAVAVVATVLLGRRFDVALREELRADPDIALKVVEA